LDVGPYRQFPAAKVLFDIGIINFIVYAAVAAEGAVYVKVSGLDEVPAPATVKAVVPSVSVKTRCHCTDLVPIAISKVAAFTPV